jgi:hypothetical protein
MVIIIIIIKSFFISFLPINHFSQDVLISINMDVNLIQWKVINYYYYYYNMNILRYTIMFPTDEGECSAAGSGGIIQRDSPGTHRLEGSMELIAVLDTLEGRKNSYAARNRTKILWSFISCHYICCTVIYFLNLM